VTEQKVMALLETNKLEEAIHLSAKAEGFSEETKEKLIKAVETLEKQGLSLRKQKNWLQNCKQF